ncbi:hypothetical protein IID19_05825 [Patescibacteria group bacterium]|nr:hypothetical protein [Patescibacteria group bacterium]
MSSNSRVNDMDMSPEGGVVSGMFAARVSSVFSRKKCVALKIKSGTLKTGDKLYFFRPKSGTAGMGDTGQETFEHTQVVDSIQIFHLGQYRQVSQISILEYPGGEKKSIVKFVDDLNNPVLLSDRHCAIAVSRLAPNNAEVTLAELVSPARADDDDEARPALILDTDNDGAC